MIAAAESSGFAKTRHKKTASTVLKSFVGNRTERSQPITPSSPTKETFEARQPTGPRYRPDQLPLGEIHHNREQGLKPQHPQENRLTRMDKSALIHKRSRSEISIRGFRKDKDKSAEDGVKAPSKEDKPKKTKSSTNLAALLGKSKSSKNISKGIVEESRNKENQPPAQPVLLPTPIFAEFSQPQSAQSKVTKIPLNDTWTVEDEAQRYTPQDYSPSKGRNFFDELPSLGSSKQARAPPKMTLLENAPLVSQQSGKLAKLRKTSSSKSFKEDKDKSKAADSREASSNPASRPTTADSSKTTKITGTSKGGSRVRAAVAAISGKAKEAPSTPKESKPNPIDIESAFEKMLESQNIAPDVKNKMRALDISVKAGLMKQDSASLPSSEAGNSSSSRTSSRHGTAAPISTNGSTSSTKNEYPESQEQSGKKPRPKSFTNFTSSKGDSSPSKKQKSENGTLRFRNKSVEIPRTSSTTSLNSIASSSSFSIFGKSQKFVAPNDFISYLRKNMKPQQLEVGRIQKLRQLLRNETVAWVDTFISDGGMIELVNLLYRIIDIQWREDHEDNLLHHTLTCLKALTTTSSAMKQLDGLQAKLFPTLLALLYSSGEEKKGPSEFTTRGLILSLLFASISASPTPKRAQELLSYLKDPTPKNAAEPLGFIAGMHRPRPYKLWCTEINNVAKEVFWIFLHSVNVIPYPADTASGTDYCTTHFPPPRPPVPAAPYVGSVEWDATTYLAIHLDLLNGVIASFTTVEDRNALRTELKDSGFEKVMGGQLRLCKEKFYGHVHAGLSTWAGAARADGWDSKDVREGPRDEVKKRARSASPVKKKTEKPPVLDMPKLDFEVRGPMTAVENGQGKLDVDGWL